MSKINWSFVEKYKGVTPPWGPVGYIVYKRTYARQIDGGTEEWWQTIYRCIRSLIDDLDAYLTQDEVEELYYYCFNLKAIFSGRALWQLGTDTIRKIGADSLQNCWLVAMNEPIEPFCFTFNQLMLGGGVGFNICREHVYEIPRVRFDPTISRTDMRDVDFIVPDNREGWVELLRRVLNAYFFTGKNLTYSTICIRDKGAKINGFGGVASGPEELVYGISQICRILSTRVGEKLKPVDVLDIQNIIGHIVVAGNVRRSAEIAIGDADDFRFINSKAWGRQQIPSWRQMSNNSVAVSNVHELPPEFWANYSDVDAMGNAVSECFGLINLHNCRRFGRLADGEDYRPDYGVQGVNPCAEITLEPYEPCNLAEIFLPNIDDEEEFITAASLLTKVTKTISRYPFSDARTNAVVGRNHRLGVSVTGVLQAPHMMDEHIFNNVYRVCEAVDLEISRQYGIKPSIKLSTVKPSGTLSLLAGVTPGGHPAYAPYYLRRITFASDDPMVNVCAAHGYHIEPKKNIDGSSNYNSMVAAFPIATPRGTLCAADMPAVTQLERQTWLQKNWADNSVSVTVYYRDEELPEIRAWLNKNYNERVKAVSFMRHSKHGFVQAPMEEITEARYKELISKTKPITQVSDTQVRDIDSMECATGACPIK